MYSRYLTADTGFIRSDGLATPNSTNEAESCSLALRLASLPCKAS